MLPEQRGVLGTFLSRFKNGKTRKSRGHARRTRRGFDAAPIEQLEPRCVLTNTLYVNFGEGFDAATTLKLTQTEWQDLGLDVPNPATNWISDPNRLGQGSWIVGPFNDAASYSGNPMITYTPFNTIVTNDKITWTSGTQPANDPYQTTGNAAANNSTKQLEQSIMQILRREFAPFNIAVVEDDKSTSVGDVQKLLAANNPLIDPYQDLTNFDPTMPTGRGTYDPDNPTGYQDAYIFVGGFTTTKTNADGTMTTDLIADDLKTLTSGGMLQSQRPQFMDPGGLVTLPGPLNYGDGGGIVAADKIAQLLTGTQTPANQNQALLNSMNVFTATCIAQTAGKIWGLINTASSGGIIDPDVSLETSSDIMRGGLNNTIGAKATTTLTSLAAFPTLQDVPIFTRFPLQTSGVNPPQNAYQTLIDNTDIGPAPPFREPALGRCRSMIMLLAPAPSTSLASMPRGTSLSSRTAVRPTCKRM